VCGGGDATLWLYFDREGHRKFIFIFLMIANCIRMVYASVLLAKLLSLTYTWDLQSFSSMVVHSLIPVVGASDWFTSLVDVVMALFWRMMLSCQTVFPTRTLLIYASVTFVGLAGTFTHDVLQFHSKTSTNPLHFWEYVLGYVGALLLIGAVLHVVSAVAVIHCALSVSDSGMRRQRLKALIPALVIVLCTSTTGTIRAMVLFGRLAGQPLFVSGALSFNNPMFTCLYITVLAQLPPVVVALIVASFTVRSMLHRIGTHAPVPTLLQPMLSGLASGETEGARRAPTRRWAILNRLSWGRTKGGQRSSTADSGGAKYTDGSEGNDGSESYTYGSESVLDASADV